MGVLPNSDIPLSDSSQHTGGGTAERAARRRRPLLLTSPAGSPTLTLERDAARETIAELWQLAAEQPAEWRIDRFGPDLATSIENLAAVVFAPQRGLVTGPPVEVRVYPVADSHAQPLLVCVATGEGPMLCRGIDDLTRALPDPWGPGPENVLDALQLVLDFAAAILSPRGARRPRATRRAEVGPPADPPAAG